MDIKITIQEVNIYIDGNKLPKETIPGDWKETILKAVTESDHKVLDNDHRPKCDCGERFSPAFVGQKYCAKCAGMEKELEAYKIAPVANKFADKANKLTKNVKTSESKAATGIKICDQCKKEYKPTSNAQRRCPDCAGIKTKSIKKEAIKPTPPVELSCMGRPLNICKHCGQKFEPVRSPLEKFCSPLCKQYYVQKYNREWYQNKAKKTETKVPKIETVAKKTETFIPKIETDVSKIEKPIRVIPSGMSGEELQQIKDRERKPE